MAETETETAALGGEAAAAAAAATTAKENAWTEEMNTIFTKA